MYNNRALVPDHAEHLARWATDSARARQALACELDVPYGKQASETLDVFPSRGERSAVLVFLHGGYWRSLDKSDHSFVAPAFHAQGACVVVPNYALCPAVTLPDIVRQMVQALAWVWRHIHRYGGNPQRITVVGHSAGAHLAAMLMACRWQEIAADMPANLVKSAVGISGLYELESIRRTPFLQKDLRLTLDHAVQCSPAWMSAPRHGSVATVVGGDESAEFIRHNRLLQQAWGKARVQVAEVLPGLNHFTVLDPLFDPESGMVTRITGLARGLE